MLFISLYEKLTFESVVLVYECEQCYKDWSRQLIRLIKKK